MDTEENERSNCSYLSICEDESQAVMSLLLCRGYFHDNEIPIRSDGIQYHPNHDQINGSSLYPKDDALLIETSNKSYIIIDVLRERFRDELNSRGRLTIANAAELFSVSSELLLLRVVPFILTVNQDQQSDKYFTTTTSAGHVKEILLTEHFQEQTKQLFHMLNDDAAAGWMLLSDAAKTIYKLPLDVTVTQLEQGGNIILMESNGVQLLLTDNASKVLVTTKYLAIIKQKLTQELKDGDSPVDVRALSKAYAWESNWVLQIIRDGLNVPGEFHGDMYIPSHYVEAKRNLVLTYYDTNGYVTSHLCYTMFDISPSQMKEYVTCSKPAESYVSLPNSIISNHTIITPLLESALDASESKHWLDLQLHIPIELLAHETHDVQILIDTVLMTKVNGVAYVRPDGALFFSEAMIQHFTKNRLFAVAKRCGTDRAKELFTSYKSQTYLLGSHDAPLGGKDKRSNRKSTKALSEDDIDTLLQEKGSFPFQELVKVVAEDYPDLLELMASPNILPEICKLAFHTDALEASWGCAIQTELQRLCNDSQTPRSLSVTENSSILDKAQSIKSAFEDPACFATSCYMIQAKAKFVVHAMECTELSESMKREIQRDFFSGCCRDFAYRVTQYAFYRNKISDERFSNYFVGLGSEIFFSPIDICSNSYGTVRFSSNTSQGELYTMLKDELPRGIGVSLAQTWDLCDAGSNDDGAESNSIVKELLEHLRDNCLTFCGLPFAMYDKKVEKKFLAARRLQLMERLEQAQNLSDALDFTIMILYQTNKNLVVSGPLLQGSILQLLYTERKLSDSAMMELRELVTKADQDNTIDSSLIERLKKLTTSKSKK